MNFYQAQDSARKRTRWLVLYFILAVVGITVTLYLASSGIMRLLEAWMTSKTVSQLTPWWDTSRFTAISIATLGVISIGSFFKAFQLNDGGQVVAKDLGGRPLDSQTTDFREKRLLNVVEEMAIASGIPAPQIWIMDDENSINAFAAGTQPSNAVIGVTRGTLHQLNRAELQGVIAHEFSHILNGDMRMNMRLIGWLFGIMMISILGQSIINSLRYIRISGSRSRENHGSGGIIIAIILAGFAMLIIGSIGVFFARMIQAAISRQREFLADASAVEFTRNPSGIADALKKVGGQARNRTLLNAKAAEASHMLFTSGGLFSYGFATHPPIEQRILSIEKSWDGKFKETQAVSKFTDEETQDSRVANFAGENSSSHVYVARQKWDQLGESSLTNIHSGQKILAGLKQEWITACHNPEQAQALIYGLLLAEDNQLLQGELQFLTSNVGDASSRLAIKWQAEILNLHSSKKIALIDLCIPTLRRLSLDEYERFIKTTEYLIQSDGQINIFEFMIQKVIARHLDVHFRRYYGKAKVRYTNLRKLAKETNTLLSTIAGIGASNMQDAQTAFDHALREFTAELPQLQLLPPEQCTLKDIDQALQKFSYANQITKRQLIYLCGLSVMLDETIGNREAEMLRAIADSIGASIPPFVNTDNH